MNQLKNSIDLRILPIFILMPFVWYFGGRMVVIWYAIGVLMFAFNILFRKRLFKMNLTQQQIKTLTGEKCPSGYCDHLYYPDNCEDCKLILSIKFKIISETEDKWRVVMVK